MDRYDVIILGGGLVGLTLGIALARHQVSVAVIDPADPDKVLATGFDGRASAVASAPWRMLQAIGVGERLEGKGCPIHAIKVQDGLSPESLMFEPSADDGALGHMFENRDLRIALDQTARAAEGLTLLRPARPATVERDLDGVRVTLADGRTITGALLIGAEGRQSPTREAAGITVARWRYEHVAMIASIAHEKPHGNVAYEIFYPAGPFAILPLIDGPDGEHRSALVWTVDEKHAPAMLGLPDRAYQAEAEKRMGGMLGAVRLISPRSSYPLGFHHAARITDTRLALVGDAAHGIHPIAGQGVNLGYRDVAALTEVLVEGMRLGLDPGDAQLLARYQRWRSLDSFLVASSTDGLTRLFGLKGRTARTVRRIGLGAVQRLGPLKKRFMAEARGETGAMPRLLQGVAI
ncbi:UbiH/UbiF/VisC/COQ6 family ubiquinone biosynthesis hydroxylase [Rhizorhabdus dicambivorans]|uniref:Ubiquinone biosynthesis protein UbiH n=1 Tax=Rhizorhabdus dicambivorans TaxID=1850238 RepID=A0A2A4FZ07_9SPHN|nr:UbiH/UbiF/VisC/COQ6 family ubiquinone biosynthesis hydroxylase [Rhizorhabdus dicambivorans]ATE66781.1 ubiquinone biosynthesis protein UbiH [Rhizorhabdus dicambivorans]PCE44024.1 ubiquinone biosynthesis protein UbiH [Rhizorhabdus dicambivorans]